MSIGATIRYARVALRIGNDFLIVQVLGCVPAPVTGQPL